MKNLFSKVGLGLMSLVALFGATSVTKAAADTDLTTSFASSTAMLSDNKAQILGYIVGIALIALVIRLGKSGVIMAIKWIMAAFAGKGKRRR